MRFRHTLTVITIATSWRAPIALAIPMSIAHTAGDSVELSPIAGVPQESNSTNKITLERVAVVLGLVVSVRAIIKTIIAVIKWMRKMRDRKGKHRQEAAGVSRNPINDEAGREARDAFALTTQPEDSNEIEIKLETLPKVVTVDKVAPPSSLPVERPSQVPTPSSSSRV
ncbi:uncharacterized protein F4822DRAFT_97234 [Hypoxylon trugodes]|uniref:uncharacterized protein n=1 Tax=Hypoxylon trugodes TaxID=326681 RepID=UPI00219E9031|nr:uncharacterized protein F4822DRAFT_97234 [Hypoxylon trugodes]KAI1382799.1 hypothetical protein F4822DRAFT_97234 [Hypoxylon trugodes]